MIDPIQLLPGVTLRCFTDHRFKQGILTMQLLRPMKEEEAALNTLLPAVLLRGCQNYPDLRQITLRLDDLYGAGMGTVVRRVGDYQTTGISCRFMEDRYAMPGDRVFAPMVDFLYQMLRQPCLEKGVFVKEFVESEKKNLLAAIDSQINDKRYYAANQLRRIMCAADSFGVDHLGNRETVSAITPQKLWTHYEKLLKESPVELFYVGSQEPTAVAQLLKPLFEGLERDPIVFPPQTSLAISPERTVSEELEVSQGKLCMGFTSDISKSDPLHVPAQVLALLYGSSTGKLFNVVREKLSLCYDIGGVYYGVKGFMVVSAGIDFDKQEKVQEEILNQLQACWDGQFSDAELQNAKISMITQLQATHDSPGAIESYYSTAVLSGLVRTPEKFIREVEQVTRQQVQQAAERFKLNTVYFLKGVG